VTHIAALGARAGTDPAAQNRRISLAPRLLAAVAGGAAVVSMCWSGLNHDVRYCLGGMQAAGRGGIPASGTFIHRPLAYRWLLSGLDHLTTGPVALREAWIRLLVIALTAAVIWWLRSGLARYLPRREAAAVAAATGLALLFAPAWDFLQPEWIAVWLAVAALGVGTGLRRMRYAVPAAGFLISLVVLVKYTTAPTALLPLGALIALDRRRGWWTAAAAAVATPAGFAFAIAVQPREWRWANEMSALNGGPLQTGLHAADLGHLIDTVGTEALMNPLVALMPAAVVLLARSTATRRARWAWPLATAAGVAGVLAALIVQGQWFQYHLAALVPLSAALWGLALARYPHRWTVAAALLLGVAVPLLAGQSLAWRGAHAALAFTLVSMAAAAALAAAFRTGQAPPQHVTAIAAVLALAIPAWPTTPYSYDTRHSSYTALERARTRQDLGHWLNGVRDRIGPDTPVTYLAFGDVGYLLGNPTHCRYPTPDFLQRTRYDRGITNQTSYHENLRCLDDPTARYAVLDTWWFPLRQVAPEVSAAVRARYDCAAPLATDPSFHLVICPRR
jgi:hypothetical protein